MVSLTIPQSDAGTFLVKAAGQLYSGSATVPAYGNCHFHTSNYDSPGFQYELTVSSSGGVGSGKYIVGQAAITVPAGTGTFPISFVCVAAQANVGAVSFTMSAIKGNIQVQ